MLRERPLDPFVRQSPGADDISDKRLVELLRYWERLRGQSERGDLPFVPAIDPAPLRFILGWLMIVEPIDGGVDFRYRLYGSAIAEVMGRDLTGCCINDSFPHFAAWTAQIYRDAMAHRQPVLTRHTPRRYVAIEQWERLILPFGDPDGAVAWFLVGAVVVRRVQGAVSIPVPWPLRDDGQVPPSDEARPRRQR